MLARLGPRGVADLALRKYRRRTRYKRMMRYVPLSRSFATLHSNCDEITSEHSAIILAKAEAMLRDENLFFTYPYLTREIERPWDYDPVEQKLWPKRHYTETKLHAEDTPRDVKIIWEINRFKDLPTLGQAALLTKDKRYADEVERRLLSWIEENPFAKTINWASALEISIRLLSWTSTLSLLRAAGFETDTHQKVARSIFVQSSYLAGDLSTDKVVPTNHLVGEAAGLFVVSQLWDYLGCKQHAELSRTLLESEILRQTYPDGATREATSWYHQFVTHFFDLAERVALRAGAPMSSQFTDRLGKMKSYLEAVTLNGEVVRYGDADDGWALFFEGDMAKWKTALFGPSIATSQGELNFFPEAKHVTLRLDESFLFLRAGEFGMGGAGYSSHAHDDYLSPVLFLDGLPVLTDPGTFVYNGNREGRAKYRTAEAHNGIIFRSSTAPVQRMNFGWHTVRPSASILSTSREMDFANTSAEYGEHPEHTRRIEIRKNSATLVDHFDRSPRIGCEWRFHLHPMWSADPSSPAENLQLFNTERDSLTIQFSRTMDSYAVEPYDFSPSYGVEKTGTLIRFTATEPTGDYSITLNLKRHIS